MSGPTAPKPFIKKGPLINLNVEIDGRRATMDLAKYLQLLEHLQWLQDELEKAQAIMAAAGLPKEKKKTEPWGYGFLGPLLGQPEND